MELAEAIIAPVGRSRGRVAAVNAEMLAWLRGLRSLVPAASDDVQTWESGMALLLLWEVDHGEPFVTGGGDGVTQRLEGFTKRLQSQVCKGSDLQSLLGSG